MSSIACVVAEVGIKSEASNVILAYLKEMPGDKIS